MKEVSAGLRKQIENGEVTAYTEAWINWTNPNSTDIIRYIHLTPNDFTLESNSYIQNGGYNFPIGNVISESIKLSIHNQTDKFYNVDLYDENAYIDLYSSIYLNGTDQTPFRIPEGRFWISDVKVSTYNVTITAYDYVSVMDYPFAIRTVDGQHQLLYPTLWDYFVYLCDSVLAPLLGVNLIGNQHFYATHLETDRFPNSTMEMSAIEPPSRIDTTLRDAFAYVAQLAGGNIVVSNEAFSLGNLIRRIDVVPYKLLLVEYINAMTFDYNFPATIDCGEFGEIIPADKFKDGGLFNDSLDYEHNNDYIVLNRYQAPPTLEYGDVQYTGVRIKYPIPNNTEGGSAEWVPDSDENVLELSNPLAQDSSDSSTKVRNAAHRIFNNIQYPIKPFNGSFQNNPLIEFMDRVVVVDVDGTAYNSFVGEHTLNYLGMSNIANRTPTKSENNRKYL